MTGRCGALLLGMLVTVLAPRTASPWSLRSPGITRGVAIGPDAVVEVVSRPTRRGGGYDVVRKRSAATGSVLWQRQWRGRTSPRWNDDVIDVAFASNGDLVASGALIAGRQRSDAVVRRLDAITGATLWQSAINDVASDGGYETATTVTVSPNGDVVAGGMLHGNLVVVALDGASGRERWRWFPAGGRASQAAPRFGIDPAGNVIAAIALVPDGELVPRGVTIVALAGDDGALRWSSGLLPNFFAVRDLTVDAHGDAYLAGSNDGFAVMKLAAATGTAQWTARLPHAFERAEHADRVLATDDGIVAAGTTNDGTGPAESDEGSFFEVVRLDPATGDLLWSHRTGGGRNSGFARELAVAADGSIVAAGAAETGTTCDDAFVTALDRNTGAPEWSESFDGPLATTDCHPACERYDTDHCQAVDRDFIRALGVDAAGRIVVGGVLIGGTRRHATTSSFLRLLDH